MSAQNDNGSQKYWYDGRPCSFIKNGSLNDGGLKYWIDGRPSIALFPETQQPAVFTSNRCSRLCPLNNGHQLIRIP